MDFSTLQLNQYVHQKEKGNERKAFYVQIVV